MKRRMPSAIVTGLVAVVVCSAFAAPVAEASLPGRNGVIAFGREVPRGDAISTLWTVDPQSGRVRQLTHVSRRCGRDPLWLDEYPSFSPSGRLIAYRHESSCGPRSPTGIYVMRSDGSGRRLIRARSRPGFAHPFPSLRRGGCWPSTAMIPVRHQARTTVDPASTRASGRFSEVRRDPAAILGLKRQAGAHPYAQGRGRGRPYRDGRP